MALLNFLTIKPKQYMLNSFFGIYEINFILCFIFLHDVSPLNRGTTDAHLQDFYQSK